MTCTASEVSGELLVFMALKRCPEDMQTETSDLVRRKLSLGLKFASCGLGFIRSLKGVLLVSSRDGIVTRQTRQDDELHRCRCTKLSFLPHPLSTSKIEGDVASVGEDLRAPPAFCEASVDTAHSW